MSSKETLKISSIKSNYIFNTVRTVLNFLTPLLIFPYTSRVLGPEGLGRVEFANSVVSYFVLFTAWGIPTYGIREIARTRDSLQERSRTVWELSIILACTVILGYITYFITISAVPIFREQLLLFLIICPTIFLSDFSYEWFYVGIEDQKYITQRYVVTKLLQIVLIFLCIKEQSHFYRYAAIMIGLNGISTVFNIGRLRKYICRVRLKNLHPIRHIKPVLIIFTSVIAVNVYTQLDITMVGLFAGDRSVGLYTAANKVVRIVIQLVTSLGAVMVPRIENSLKKGDIENYRRNLWVSLRFVFMIGLPSVIGIELLAEHIISLFAGSEYLEAVISIRLLAPIILIVGLAYFVGFQVLYPNRRESVYTLAVTVSALLNGVFNYFMIQVYGHNGAIMGTVVAETTSLVIMGIVGRKYIKDSQALGLDLVKYCVASVIMGTVILLVKPIFAGLNEYLSLGICVGIGVFVYFLSLLLLKDKCLGVVVKRKI